MKEMATGRKGSVPHPSGVRLDRDGGRERCLPRGSGVWEGEGLEREDAMLALVAGEEGERRGGARREWWTSRGG